MPERLTDNTFATKVDRYLRREDTKVAHAIQQICPLQGEEYRNSQSKRTFERVVTLPVAATTLPVVGILGLLAKVEDGGKMFFTQERCGQDGKPVKIVKIRTMKEGSEDPASALLYMAKYQPEIDPRNTKLGKVIRAYEIDEFPQFIQILKGTLSLVDIRSMVKFCMDNLQNKRPQIFNEWYSAYSSGKPGLLSLNSAMNSERKNDLKRVHYDLLYARKASLGLDLFIIYRTAIRMLRRVEEKMKGKK